MKIKKDLESMKNCGVKSDVSLGQELNAQMITMKGIWKLNLIQMRSYLYKFLAC